MSGKRPPRRLLACAALSAGVLLGASGSASADAPAPRRAPSPPPIAALVQTAERLAQQALSALSEAPVALHPQRRMGNTKGPAYTDRCARVMLACATRADPEPPTDL
jgi:hypothetical protein